MTHYSIDEVEDYFASILERIEEVLGDTVVVDDYDEEWVEFHLSNLVDRAAIAQIEKHNGQILLGEERQEFQILCPWSPAEGEGLYLHYLADDVAKGEYRAGVWFY